MFIRYLHIANGDRGRSAQSGVHDRAPRRLPEPDPAICNMLKHATSVQRTCDTDRCSGQASINFVSINTILLTILC